MLIDLKLGYVFFSFFVFTRCWPNLELFWKLYYIKFHLPDTRRTQFPWVVYMRASVSHSCQVKADSSSEKPVAIPWLLNMSTYFLMANH